MLCDMSKYLTVATNDNKVKCVEDWSLQINLPYILVGGSVQLLNYNKRHKIFRKRNKQNPRKNVENIKTNLTHVCTDEKIIELWANQLSNSATNDDI